MDPFALNLIMIIGFVVGSCLIVTEAFIPGFGVAGFSGVVLEVAALCCCWRLHGTVPTLLALLGVLLLIGLAIFFSYRSAMNGRLSKSNLILKATESVAGESAPDPRIGREGVTVTALRPAGKVDVEGTSLNAASRGEFIEKGAAVLITGVEGDHYTVARKA